MLEVSLTCSTFISPCNVFFRNVLWLAIEVNLTFYRCVFPLNIVLANMLACELELNLACARFLSLQCCYAILFVLKGNITQVIFISPSNIFISNVDVFLLKRDLASARFLLPCNIVVSNIFMYVLLVVLEENLAHYRFILLMCVV